MIERICKCGNTFEVLHPSSNRLNCSAKCRGVKGKRRADAGTRKVEWVTRACPCGQPFEVPPWGAVEGKGRVYCDRVCRDKYRKPPRSNPRRVVHMRRIAPDGYAWIYLPVEERPPGWTRAHTPEHRHVMSQIIGRHLLPNENVHHINGVKDDNRPENLELWVCKQPKGQRVSDLLAHAREVIEMYEPLEHKLN